MKMRCPVVPAPITLAVGLALGWWLAGARAPGLRAQGGDRVAESILTTGPVSVDYNQVRKVQVPQDGLYYLDYSGARLVAAVPSYQQTVNGVHVLGDFAERDLIADFALPRGTVPHFLMTTGALGAFGEGWAPVYVLETSTRQVAAYRLVEQRTATSTSPRFDLLERRPIVRSTLPPPG